MPQAHSATPGRNGEPLPRLGDFEIIERIGQGAVGAVFKARQRSMDRLVAVKVLKPRLAENPEYVERFWREARAAARLSHPNIVLAIDAGEAHGYYYFVMEYVEGHPVSLLRKAAVFGERRGLEVARQVAEALDYAWGQERIVHRDIKPGNIIITPDGTAKLADLGLAQDAVLAAEEDEDNDGGAVLGTPLYIAPEQIRREPDLDVRCDLYALGATLFHMVTGRPPFRDPDAKSILRKHLHDPVPDPREFRPELSDGISHILLKLLKKDRDERYPDAQALIADIDTVLATGHLPGRGAPSVRRVPARRRRGAMSGLLMGALVLLALAGAAFGIWRLRVHQRWEARRKLSSATDPTSVVSPETSTPAQRAYEEAVAYAEAHPTDYVQAIARFRAVEKAHANTTYAKLAAPWRQRLEAGLDEKAEDTLKALSRKAEQAAAAGRYATALATFDRFPASLATAEWRGHVADARKTIERKARQHFLASLAPGDKAAAKGDLGEALKLFQAVPKPAIAAWRDEVAERIADVGRRQRELAEAAKAKARAGHLRLLARAAALYRKREYDAAEKLVRPALETAPPERRPDIESELAELGELRLFWQTVEAGARSFIGQPHSVRGIPGRISAVGQGTLTIETRGRPFSQKLIELDAATALKFAFAALDEGRRTLAAARFLIAEGKAAEAATRLDELEAAGADVAAHRDRLERLCRGELRAAVRDAFRQAREAEDPQAALRAFVERYQGHAAAADLCAEARRLLDAAAKPEPPAPADSLPARLRLACDGTCKIFLNGKAIPTAAYTEGQLESHELEVKDGDVLACEVSSQSKHRGLYALLSVADGRYILATDASWQSGDEPPEGWRTDPKPGGTWRPARLACSPHVKPGFEETGRGLAGYWIWGRGETCAFHKVIRLTRTAAQAAEAERARQAALTKDHGKPTRATLTVECAGPCFVYHGGRLVGGAAARVPKAVYELSVRQGDVIGLHVSGDGDTGRLSARLDVDGIPIPIHTDRSWVYTTTANAAKWAERGTPAGTWQAPRLLDAQGDAVWGQGPELFVRKRIDLDKLRSRDADMGQLIRGRIAAHGERRTDIVYDLADPEQLADWHSPGDLAWKNQRIGGTAHPVYTGPFYTREIQIDADIQPIGDLVIGLWGSAPGRRTGYTLAVSDSRRATVILRRNGQTLWMERVNTSSGASRRVSLRRYGRLFTVAIDGRRVFSNRDDDPIDSDEIWRVGFMSGAGSRGNIKAIRIAGRIDWSRLAGERRGQSAAPPPEPEGPPNE